MPLEYQREQSSLWHYDGTFVCQLQTHTAKERPGCRLENGTKEPGMLMHRLSLQRERSITCFPPRRLGADMVNNLVTSVLSCVAETTQDLPSHLELVFLSQSTRACLYGRCHLYFTKRSDVVMA